MKPSTQASSSDVASEHQLQTRASEVKSSARRISAAVNTDDGDGGCSGPPGTGSHGTRSTASDHEGDGAGHRHPDGHPSAAPLVQRVRSGSARSAARSRSRCSPARGQLGLGEPEQGPQLAGQVAAAGDLLVEPDQGVLAALVGEHQAGDPGALVRRAEVGRGLVELGLPGQVVRRAVAAYLLR